MGNGHRKELCRYVWRFTNKTVWRKQSGKPNDTCEIPAQNDLSFCTAGCMLRLDITYQFRLRNKTLKQRLSIPFVISKQPIKRPKLRRYEHRNSKTRLLLWASMQSWSVARCLGVLIIKYGSKDKRLSHEAHILRGVGSTPTTAPKQIKLYLEKYILSTQCKLSFAVIAETRRNGQQDTKDGYVWILDCTCAGDFTSEAE